MDHVRTNGTVLERWLRHYIWEYDNPRDTTGYVDHVRHGGTVMGRGTRDYAYEYHRDRATADYMGTGTFRGAIMGYLNGSGRPRKGAL